MFQGSYPRGECCNCSAYKVNYSTVPNLSCIFATQRQSIKERNPSRAEHRTDPAGCAVTGLGIQRD